MGRLIDVDALRADYGMAEDCKDCKTEWRSCQYDRIYSKMDFCGWLDDAPTVDAVPVRRGKWKHKKDLKQFFCDQCGEPSLTEDDVYFYGMEFPNFCPNCGADMRKDGDQ